MKKIFIIIIAIMLFFGCSSNKVKTLNILSQTQYISQNLIKNFEYQYNCKVIIHEELSYDNIFNLLRVSSRQYDIVIASDTVTQKLAEHRMTSRLKKYLIGNLSAIDSQFDYLCDPSFEYVVPYFFGLNGIIINNENINDFYGHLGDANLVDHIYISDDLQEMMGVALLNLGFDTKTINIEQLKLASEYIRAHQLSSMNLHPNQFFDEDHTTIWAVYQKSRRVYKELYSLEEQFSFFLPVEGTMHYLDCMTILNNSKNKELAHQFINYVCSPKVYAGFLNEFRLPSAVNLKARDFINNDRLLYTFGDIEMSYDMPAFDTVYGRNRLELRK